MGENEKEQFEKILQEIKDNNVLIKKLIGYLKSRNLLGDLYSKLYYMIEKSEILYKIKYYKNTLNGKLLSLSDVKNNFDLLKEHLQEYIVYVYDEIKSIHFKGREVGREVSRRQEYSKSYNNLTIKIDMLNKDDDFENVNWLNIINQNPLLFVYIILEYNINIDELKNVDEKSYTYKKEIKKN